jgi:competence protein ComEA
MFLSTIKEYKIPLFLFGFGICILLTGFFLIFFLSSDTKKVQTIDIETDDNRQVSLISVDVEGEVQKPGVYELESGSRIDDLIQVSGGFSSQADLVMVAKTINKAKILSDGEKVYIPAQNGNNTSNESVLGTDNAEILININTASGVELEALSGIGVKTSEKIQAGRPYGSIEELLEKKIVGQSTFEKIKELVTAY